MAHIKWTYLLPNTNIHLVLLLWCHLDNFSWLLMAPVCCTCNLCQVYVRKSRPLLLSEMQNEQTSVHSATHFVWRSLAKHSHLISGGSCSTSKYSLPFWFNVTVTSPSHNTSSSNGEACMRTWCWETPQPSVTEFSSFLSKRNLTGKKSQESDSHKHKSYDIPTISWHLLFCSILCELLCK